MSLPAKMSLCYNSAVGTLFLVATPIGNLKDITLRALEVLQSVTLIAAEDTRHTRKLLSTEGISTRLVSYHEHNKQEREAQLLSALEEGDIALVSDAGTPVVSDPGYELVRLAVQHGHRVVPIPGPSAPIAALIASGLPSDAFTFVGYLPRRRAERKSFLAMYRERPETLLMFEVPHRLKASLSDLAEIFGPQRQAAVCRELTKLHEEIRRGTLVELLEGYQGEEPRGECTLVIAGAPEDVAIWPREEVERELQRRLAEGIPPSRAAREIAALSGWKRQDIYRMGLEEE